MKPMSKPGDRVVWTTKDKQRLHVCEMDDLHLANTVRMLLRIKQSIDYNDVMRSLIDEMCRRKLEL